MKTLTELALAGTVLGGSPSGATDERLKRLDGVGVERRILLQAGVRATLRAAGYRAHDVVPSTPAPADARSACTVRVARLVESMLEGTHQELLPEALARLDAARLRLPHALLPRALSVRDEGMRSAIRPLLDARGAWLAAHDARGAWVVDTGFRTRAALEKAWTEGTSAERRAALVAVRESDPALARAWIDAAWATEGAGFRTMVVEVVGAGPEMDDEGLLERALADRSPGVRGAAQMALGRLPGSAFVARMEARADACLGWSRPALGFLGRRATLTVNPPETRDDATERDVGKAPATVGAKAFWISRVMSTVPPAHWESRFGAGPEAIVAAMASTDWAVSLVDGWTTAALAHKASSWLVPLWRFWQSVDERAAPTVTSQQKLVGILAGFAGGEADDLVIEVLEQDVRPGIGLVLNALPMPWTGRVASAWLAAVRRSLASPKGDARWLATLPRAALALPPSAFASATAIELAGPSSWERAFLSFSESICVRQTLHQETP